MAAVIYSFQKAKSAVNPDDLFYIVSGKVRNFLCGGYMQIPDVLHADQFRCAEMP